MPVRIREKSESESEKPLQLLSDCHDRIKQFLHMLLAVARQARGGELNPEQRGALETALTYFQEGAPKHARDEEESLFPRMRRLSNEQIRSVLTRLETLEKEHARANERHQVVEALGRQWLAEGQLSAPALDRFSEQLGELSVLYHEHIQVEETEIFPLAEQLLPESEILAIRHEMAARRSIRPEAPPLLR